MRFIKEKFAAIRTAKLSLSNIKLGLYYQFLRMGYFCFDSNSRADKLIFNRTSTLRDSWKTV